MLKFIKYSIYTILTLILLLIIGIVILINVVNPNNYKAPIQNQISQALNRNTHIDGDISWRFFPSLAISVQQVKIDNPDNFENDAFANIGEIAFRVETLPLLRGEVNIGNISLDEMNINIEFNKDGQSNLEGIGDSASDDTPSGQESNSDDSSSLPISGLKIKNVSLNDSAIHYSDRESDLAFKIEDIRFQSRNIETNRAFPIRLNFKFNGIQDGNEFTSGNARLNGRVKLDLEQLISSSFESMAEILDPITFKGQLIITPLQLSGLSIDDVSAQLQVAQRQIEINPITAHLYQGVSTSNIMVDFTNPMPQYTFNESIENIQAGDFFTDYIGTSRITGRANFTMNVTASGEDSAAITRSLNGSGSYSFRDGHLEGVNIAQIIDTATALFNNQQAPETDSNNTTAFAELTGTFNIVDGVIRNEDMQMKSPHLQVAGRGAINLNNEQINYRVQAKIPNLGERTAVQQVQDNLGGGIPLLVTGTFENMLVAPDVETILNSRARSFISDQLSNLIGNDEDDNDGENPNVADQINNLLGNRNNNDENSDPENSNNNISLEQAANRFLNRLMQ